MHFDIWLLIFAKGTVSNEDCIIGKVGETSADFLDGEQRKLFEKVGLFFFQRLLLTKEISYERLGYGKSMKIRFINAIVVVGICFIYLKILQPIIFSLVSLIPRIIVNITALLLALLLVVDIVLTYIFVRKYPMQNIEEDISRRKKTFGEWISKNIWKKIYKLYPSLLSDDFEDSNKGISDADKLLEEQGIIFAKGISLAKLIWILFWWCV